MTCQRAQLVILFGNNDIFNNRFNNVTGIIGFSSKPQPARFLEIYIHTYIRVRPCVRIPFPLVRVHQLSPLVLIYTSCFILYTWILVLVNVCTCAIYVLYARRKCGRNLVWSFNCDILLLPSYILNKPEPRCPSSHHANISCNLYNALYQIDAGIIEVFFLLLFFYQGRIMSINNLYN